MIYFNFCGAENGSFFFLCVQYSTLSDGLDTVLFVTGMYLRGLNTVTAKAVPIIISKADQSWNLSTHQVLSQE